jgi:hypothetical protein
VLTVGDRHDLPLAFLVHLGRANVEQQTGGLVLDGCQSERDEFGAAHRGGVAEQDDRGVA